MSDWTARLLNFKRGELPLALLAALFYFCVLGGYYFLRPVRDAMGVSGGLEQLHWLFVLTSLGSLVIVLLFGGVVSRLDRRRFIPIAYLFIIACLLLFSALLIMNTLTGGGAIGTRSPSAVVRGVAYSFYVWVSVINLFVNSLFWAFMVDVFDVDQGKRMFAFIGVGGTMGAAFGGWATKLASSATSSHFLPPGLMLAGAALFGAAILVMLKLDRAAAASEYSRLTAQGGASKSMPESASGSAAKPALQRADSKLSDGSAPSAPRPDRIGGTFWDGATAVARSPYLLGIGAYIAFLAISNTLIYFAGANVVLDNTDTLSQRVGGFAQFDLLANIVTLFTQIFITTRLIRRIGVGWTLSVLPLVTVAGFAVLAVWPLFGVMALFQAVSRATRYAVSRPSRETLFSVVPPAEKYKAKPMIDVFVYRGGDVAGAAFDAGMRALGLPLIGVAAAAVPVAGVWTLLCLALGRTQQRRDRELKRLAAGAAPSGAAEPAPAAEAGESARLAAGAGRQS